MQIIYLLLSNWELGRFKLRVNPDVFRMSFGSKNHFVPFSRRVPTKLFDSFSRGRPSVTWVEQRVLQVLGIPLPPVAPVVVTWTATKWYDAAALSPLDRIDEHTIWRERIPLGMFGSVVDGLEDALKLQALMKRQPERLASPYWAPVRLVKLMRPPQVGFCGRREDLFTTSSGLQLVNAAQTTDQAAVEEMCRSVSLPRFIDWDGQHSVLECQAAIKVHERVCAISPRAKLTMPILLVPPEALPSESALAPDQCLTIDGRQWVHLWHSFTELAHAMREY